MANTNGNGWLFTVCVVFLLPSSSSLQLHLTAQSERMPLSFNKVPYRTPESDVWFHNQKERLNPES
eukprot:scaffold6502_cov184-Skeletonema_dohrnii-CCMP3373.AAC.2